MTTKKENAKRLGIYLLTVFTFMLIFVLCIKPMNASNTVFYIIYMIFSFSPAIASLITRAVTKEGFRDMKLHLKLSGNFKWYLLASGPACLTCRGHMKRSICAAYFSWSC